MSVLRGGNGHCGAVRVGEAVPGPVIGMIPVVTVCNPQATVFVDSVVGEKTDSHVVVVNVRQVTERGSASAGSW